MKILGTVTKQMFYNQNNTFKSYTDLKNYKIPLDTIMALDIGRIIYLNEDSMEVELETFRAKTIRETKTFLYEKEENRPIINDTSSVSH